MGRSFCRERGPSGAAGAKGISLLRSYETLRCFLVRNQLASHLIFETDPIVSKTERRDCVRKTRASAQFNKLVKTLIFRSH